MAAHFTIAVLFLISVCLPAFAQQTATAEVRLAEGGDGTAEAAVKTWAPIRWHEMSVGERTEGVRIEKLGEAETRDPGRPRSSVDPLRPPDGSGPGVFHDRQIDYFIPFYTAHPGKEALAWFERLVRDKPDVAMYRGRLALSHMQLGQFAEALEESSRAVALDAKEPWGHLSRALTEQNLFHLDEAAAAFRTLLDLAPQGFGDSFFTRDFLLQSLADVELRRGNREEAEKLLLEAYATEKNNLFAQKMMERFYLRSGQTEKALALYRKILEKEPDNYNARLNLGCLLNFTNKPAEALVELEKARELQPELIHAHFALHRSHFALGQLEEALADLKKCRSFDMETQNNLAVPGNIVTPFPEPTMLFQQTALALGDWKLLREIESYLANFYPPLIIENEISDDIPGHRGYPEWCDEDSMRFHFETRGKEMVKNRFLERLDALLAPTTPRGAQKAQLAAEQLRTGQGEAALRTADEGRKLEPDCLLFILQRAMALRQLRRFDELWATEALLAGLAEKARKDSLDEFALLLARVLCRCDMGVKAVTAPGGETLYLPGMLTENFTSEERRKLHEFYQSTRKRAAEIRESSLSVMQRALSSLIITRLATDMRQSKEAAFHYADYIRYDGEFAALRWLFAHFGVYYGF